MLPKNMIESELSVAYVHAVAAHSGYALEFKRIDYDSVDITIDTTGKINDESILISPTVAIQLKATKSYSINEKNEIPYFLKLKNYNDLKANNLVPKILVLLCLPEEEEKWLKLTQEELILKKCAYWKSIKGYPDTENDTGETIYIPTENIFSPDNLKSILLKISKEEDL